jgi:CubicO group peptidase (beta-lactamase class C family)
MTKGFLVGLVTFALGQIGLAQGDKAKRIDEFVRPFAQANQFSGVVLASENGKIIYEKAFGYANADYKIPNEQNTRIGIASITKLMTAVIRTRLVEDKKISMDDKVSKYIPDFPNGDKITVDMLSSHRAGIPHRVMRAEQESLPHSSADMVEWIKQAKPLFEPGTKRTYSSAGYTLLTRVLEIASGKSYRQLLDEYVFRPASMRDSLDFESETIMERRAQDYLLDQDGPINAGLKDYSFLVGAGSVFSTAADLNRFGEAIVDGKYGADVKARLLGTAENVAGSGSTNGHRSYLEIEKGKKYSYVLLANLSCGAFDAIQQGVRDIMQGKDVSPPVVVHPKIIPNPNKDMAEFFGKYRAADGSETEVMLRDGRLYATDIRLYPTAVDCFFEYKFFGTACFVRDAAGKVKEIQWKGTNFSLMWTKQ